MMDQIYQMFMKNRKGRGKNKRKTRQSIGRKRNQTLHIQVSYILTITQIDLYWLVERKIKRGKKLKVDIGNSYRLGSQTETISDNSSSERSIP